MTYFYMKVLLTPIAILSVITNGAVIILFLRNRAWLKRPYNVFILSLSFTDMLTGIVMFLTPGTIFDDPIKPPNYLIIGWLYCNLLWPRWLLFAQGAVSVYTCLFLTVERWTAICRPFKYRARFASKRLIGFLFLVWFLGLSTAYIGAFQVKFVPANFNHTTPSCIMIPTVQPNLGGLVAILSVSAKFVLPSVIIIVLYTLAILGIKKNNRQIQGQTTRNQAALKSVTKMAATASMVLVFCWLPNQIYYTLAMFRLASAFNHIHNATSVVVLLSSTLNPFIYGLWGKQFRSGIKAALCCCHRRGPRSTMKVGRGNGGFHTAKNKRCFPNSGEDTTM